MRLPSRRQRCGPTSLPRWPSRPTPTRALRREATLRFLAAPTDVNWGGKTHGGTVMRWIDEAAFVCAAGWSRQNCIAAYSGGIRFYRPIMIGRHRRGGGPIAAHRPQQHARIGARPVR